LSFSIAIVLMLASANQLTAIYTITKEVATHDLTVVRAML